MSNELRADSFARIDFREYMSRAILNNIGLAGMGHDFQTLKQPDTDLRSHHRKLILDPTRVFSWVGLLSRYFDMRLLMRVPLKKLIEISQSAKYLRELTTAVIQGRREQLVVAENNRAKDIITVALAGGVFDEHHLVDHVMTFLTAGHESTATAFEWTMYELGRQPEMQSRLRDELRATIGTDLAAVDFGLRVQNLPYLNAFCSEVLRCYPFSPIIVKVAQKETMLIGQRIPKGTVVLYSAEVSNHDKTLWVMRISSIRSGGWARRRQSLVVLRVIMRCLHLARVHGTALERILPGRRLSVLLRQCCLRLRSSLRILIRRGD